MVYNTCGLRARVRAVAYGSAPWSAHWQNRTMTQKTHGHMRESKSPYASSLLHRAHLAANPSTPRLRERRDSARLDGPHRLVLQRALEASRRAQPQGASSLCPRSSSARRLETLVSESEGRATRVSLLRERGESHSRVSSLRERARGEPLEFRYSESERAGRATRDSSRCSPHCHTLRSSGRA